MNKKSFSLRIISTLLLLIPIQAGSVTENNNLKTKEIIIKGCEPFSSVKSNEKAVLLLHGLGGCPHEVRELGEFLSNNGFTTVGIRYPGHGALGKVMSEYGWEDWYKEAEAEYLKLKQTYPHVYVIGFSTGGTLGLRLSQKFPVEKLILLSPFIFLTHKWYYGFSPEIYVNSIGKLFDDLPANMTIVNLNEPKARANYIRGDFFSVKATRSALELIELVKKDIKNVNSPTLLMHSKNDDTTDFKSSQYIFDNIASQQKKLVPLQKSNHVIPLDYEKEIVFKEVNDFISQND